jgi:apolipoprotein N-acyltransferase
MRRRLIILPTVVASAVCVAVGFVGAGLVGLSLVAVTGLAYCVVGRKGVPRRFGGLSYLFGLVYFGVVMSWMFNIHATELIEDSFLAGVFKSLTLFLIVSVLAVGFVITGLMIKKALQRGMSQNWLLVIIPSAWVIGEYLRSVGFSVFSYGPGGSIGPYWNFGTVGFLTAETPLRYAGRLVGLYGLSFLVVFSAVVVVLAVKRRKAYALLLAVPIVLSTAGWAMYRVAAGPTVKTGVVSVGSEAEGYQAELTELFRGSDAETIVLPEYSYYFIDDDGVQREGQDADKDQLFIDSATIPVPGGVGYNAVHYHDAGGNRLAYEKKSFLIPGGEYVPYIYSFILGLSGNELIIQDFQQNKSVEKSETKERPYVWGDVSYGGLACSGAIAPGEYGSLVGQGAEVVTNSASISTLGVSDGFYAQAYSMAKFTAVANARPFVQASRGGDSYVLDKDGNVQEVVRANSNGVALAEADVQTNSTKTLYAILGEWMVPVSFVIVGVGFALAGKPSRGARRRREK